MIQPDGAHGHVPRAGERDIRPTLARMPMTASALPEPRWCGTKPPIPEAALRAVFMPGFASSVRPAGVIAS